MNLRPRAKHPDSPSSLVRRFRLAMVILFAAIACFASAQSVKSLSVSPTSVYGGASATFTVTLTSAAPSGGLTVNIASNNAAATVPSPTVKVSANATSTGLEEWEYDAPDYVGVPVIGPDGTIYFESSGDLYAISPSTHKKKWAYTADVGSPAIGPDGTIYASSTSEKKLYAITPAGAKKWTYAAEGSFDTDPVVGLDGTIYVGNYGTMMAFNSDGAVKWTWDNANYDQNGPIIGPDGSIYIGAGVSPGAFYRIKQ